MIGDTTLLMPSINNRLRVLTYNMYGVPFLDSKKKERFAQFSKEVIAQDRYDLYCFQVCRLNVRIVVD